MKAVIPVAGFGTRFLPATKTQPKEMLPIVDTPIIQYVVEEVVESGVKDVIFITTRYKRSLEDYFDSHFELEATLRSRGKSEAVNELRRIVKLARFAFVRQHAPLGNGDALLAAWHLFRAEPVLVAFGDDIFVGKELVSKKLIELYGRFHAPVCVIKKVPKSHVSSYGIVRAKKIGLREYQILDVVEKPHLKNAPSNMAIFGRYVLTPDIMRRLQKLHPPARGKELGLTDGLRAHLKGGGALYAYEISPQLHFDCGSKIEYLKATIYFALRHKDLRHEFRSHLRSLEL